ncbi:biotin--[acetyl-CoA-carboxylase] ligase [Prochlorococcus marinus]|uniref:biotin--[acetyl-CoA-carboxylase] ligase n=1 Tax=Prochlorococcus marinus TaxID=1219 RepID=UPI0022B47B1A|nr:biotin--[acetyl-CoA-carboxylase] ligase [Prochlorococcus marinus]
MNNQKFDRGVGLIYRYHKLNHPTSRSWRLILKPICASTEIELSNWIAKKPVKQNQPIAIFSSCQRFGQGQAGRVWYAPKGGVWVSAAIRIEDICENNSQLYGLAVALALVERIERIGVNVKIKWPNDLLVDGQKLAGILPRLSFRGGKLRLLRVGVGLNVFNNVPEEGVSLKQIIGNKKINLNFWSSEVLLAIERSLDFLYNKNFLSSQVEQRLWSKKYIDKETGYKWDIKGLDSSGRLILFKDDNEKVLSI